MKIQLFLLLGTILCVCSHQINHVATSGMRSASVSGLQGFPHYVGRSFGEDKATAFLNFINTAASLYRDDLEKNLKYLQANMQAAFGVGNQTYSVVIQVNSSSSATDTFIYNTWGDTYASFPTGTSLINPTWSFFSYMLQRYDNWIITYVPQTGQGTGISLITVNAIRDIIKKRDGTGKCTCRETFFVQMDINLFDGQYWNVVCHSQPISEGYVLVRDKQWISMKPYECYYMIYAL